LKFTIYVKKLDNPYRVAYHRILKHYGAGCYPGEPQERDDHWCVPIEAYAPSRVIDEKTGRERILTFYLRNVGELWIKKSTMAIKKAPSLRSVGKKILERRGEIRKIVENDLIRVLGDPELKIRFGVMKFAVFGLQPIYRTVNNLLLEKYPTRVDLEEIGIHYLDQVNLIVSLGYARYTDEHPSRLVPTNKLFELYRRTGDVIGTAEAMLGIVLANYYDYLLQTMRIIHFVPYVRASTSYYGDAIQFGELISITENRLRENIRAYYRGAPLPTMRARFGYSTIIKELIDAHVLNYDGEFITGRYEIFDRLIDVRNELPMSEEPYTL